MKLAELNELDFSNAGEWPLPMQALAVLFVIGAVVGAGYWFFIQDRLAALNTARGAEGQLRQELMIKQRLAPDVASRQGQLEALRLRLDSQLSQLSSRTETADLLEDITRLGRTNGLSFETFKPETEQPREFYAARPISIRARGGFHQFGLFTSSLAALPRLVTLENVKLMTPQLRPGRRAAGDGGLLLIEATLQTYRLLDRKDPAVVANKGGAR